MTRIGVAAITAAEQFSSILRLLPANWSPHCRLDVEVVEVSQGRMGQ